MKCPYLFNIIQKVTKEPILNELEDTTGEKTMFVENQMMANCCGEDCMAFDKATQRCKKIEKGD